MTTKVLSFLRETLPHGDYKLMEHGVVMSHGELVGYALGQLVSEGRVSLWAHHMGTHDDFDIVLDPYEYEKVLKVLKRHVVLVDTEYGFGDYRFEMVAELDLTLE